MNFAFPRLRAPGDRRAGLTLLEMLISIAIVAVVVVALERVLAVALGGGQYQEDREDMLARARFAMDHMSRFVRETDAIVYPVTNTAVAFLEVRERALDTYVNATRAYTPTGEVTHVLDADNNSDGLVNNNAVSDPAETIRFWVDVRQSGNPRLMETRPNYATANLYDTVTNGPLCEAVSSLACRRLGAGLVELRLTLARDDARVSLRTCAKARQLQ